MRHERAPDPPTRRRVSSTPAAYRKLPFLLVAIGIATFLGIRGATSLLVRDGSRRQGLPEEAVWRLVGDGETQFLGVVKPFQIHQRDGASERFRIETETSAFENQRFDGAIQSFVRDSVAGVRPGESLRLLFRRASLLVRPGVPAKATEDGATADGTALEGVVQWKVSILEEKRGTETWYRLESHPLEARTTEDLKERVAREVARSVWTVFRGDSGG